MTLAEIIIGILFFGIIISQYIKYNNLESKVDNISKDISDIKNNNSESKLDDISKDIIGLVNTLTKSGTGTGDWGEFVLEKALENAGLRRGHEYLYNNVIEGSDSQARPDIQIKLPDNRYIIIDSKVSVESWHMAQNSTEKGQIKTYMEAHKTAVETHIERLSKKEYPSLFPEHNSLDFSVMFMAIDAAYTDTSREYPEIIEKAIRQKIAIVGPSTLIIVLKIIENMWNLEKQNKNISQIVQIGSTLFDKVRLINETFADAKKNIDAAQGNMEKLQKKLDENLSAKALKMRKMGGLQVKTEFDSETMERIENLDDSNTD